MKSLTVTALLCVGLSACTSSYQGVRLKPDGSQPATANLTYGVPFSLTRPQFRVQKDDKGEMSVAVDYVLDPNHRYSLRPNPALFADVGFKITYGENGAPNGITSKTTDQLVPTVIALLKAGASITSALAAADAGQIVESNGILFDGCLAHTSNWQRASCAIKRAAEDEAKGNKPVLVCTADVVNDLQFLVASFKGADGKDKGSLKGGLYGETPRHAGCLTQASKVLTDEVGAKTGKLVETATKAFTDGGFPEATIDSTAKKALEKLSATIKTADAEAIARIRGAVRRFGQGKEDSRPDFFKAEFEGYKDEAKNIPLVAAITAALKETKLDSDDAGNVVARLKAPLDVAKFLADAALLGPEQWLPRHIADLDRREAFAERDALMSNPVATGKGEPAESEILGPSSNAKVQEIRRKQAAAVDLVPEHKRLLLIRDELNTLPKLSPADRQSQTSEYVLLRQEAERLETLLSTKLTAARGLAAKDDEKEKFPLETPWVAKTCLNKVADDKDWRFTDGLTAPKYVIALKRAGTNEYLTPEVNPCAAINSAP